MRAHRSLIICSFLEHYIMKVSIYNPVLMCNLYYVSSSGGGGGGGFDSGYMSGMGGGSGGGMNSGLGGGYGKNDNGNDVKVSLRAK
jgi:hypothetical protein